MDVLEVLENIKAWIMGKNETFNCEAEEREIFALQF